MVKLKRGKWRNKAKLRLQFGEWFDQIIFFFTVQVISKHRADSCVSLN